MQRLRNNEGITIKIRQRQIKINRSVWSVSTIRMVEIPTYKHIQKVGMKHFEVNVVTLSPVRHSERGVEEFDENRQE